MGKGLIITVLGVSIIIGALMMNLNSNSLAGLQSTIDLFEQTQARLIANSGIEVYLEKLKNNKTLSGSFHHNILMGGEYDINIYGPDSALKITSLSRFNNVTHKSIALAKRSPISLPVINSSIYVASSSTSLNLNGNVSIDGHDTNLDGTPGPNPALPGVAVDDPVDSAYWKNTLKTKILGTIDGQGGAPSIKTVPTTNNWDDLTQNYIMATDLTLGSGNYSSGSVFGTISHPKITYVTGNVHFSGNATGAGIMVINGNLTMSGNFSYYGILICYGQSTITTQIVGNGGIYGATILAGNNIDIQATGNSAFFYSSQALSLAQNNLKSSRFSIVNWWE